VEEDTYTLTEELAACLQYAEDRKWLMFLGSAPAEADCAIRSGFDGEEVFVDAVAELWRQFE